MELTGGGVLVCMLHIVLRCDARPGTAGPNRQLCECWRVAGAAGLAYRMCYSVCWQACELLCRPATGGFGPHV